MRRRYDPNSDFFLEGNIARYNSFKVKCYPEGLDNEQVDSYQYTFECKEDGCKQSFSTISKYEAHMFNCHQHRCSVCGKSFQSDRLLSIHISELHDTYFQLMAKKKPSYVCLVENCPVLSLSNDDRRQHLIDIHMYPKSYDFHNPRKYRRAANKLKGQPKGGQKGTTDDAMTTTTNDSINSSSSNSGVMTRKDRRNKKKLELTQNNQQDSVMEVSGGMHTTTAHITATATAAGAVIPADNTNNSKITATAEEAYDSMDVEMDILTEAFARKVNTKIPSKIRFGGRGRGMH